MIQQERDAMEHDFSKPVDKIESVPADFRSLYVEKDGKFVLDSEDAKVKSAVSAVVGLNNALRASRAEARAAKESLPDLSPLSEFGTDPKSIRAKVDELLKATKGKGTEDVDKAVEAARKAMAEEHAKQLAAEKTRGETLQGQLHKVLVSGEATAALAAANAVDVDLAIPHIVNRVKVVEENGEMHVRVMNPEGEPRFSGVTGKHMTIAELVSEMKGMEKFGVLFKSDAPSGGGGQPTRRPASGGGGGRNRDDMSSTEKIAAGLAKGQFSRSGGRNP